MRLAFAVWVTASLALPASDSRWSLLSENGKGSFVLSPSCHPLAYFSGSPLRFDREGWYRRIKNPSDLRSVTERKVIGTIAGRRIVQVTQNINDSETVMKRLLIRRSPNQYCMIFQQQYGGGTVHAGPAYILRLGDQSVLATRDRVDGTGVGYVEHYWTFDAAGPVEVDLSAIREHTKALLPAGHGIWKGYGLDMTNLCYGIGVWKESDANCCPSGGSVVLKLALNGHRIEVVDSRYSPEADSQPLKCLE